MADIPAETAAKRPFDEHRLAVLILLIFLLELCAPAPREKAATVEFET
jgi:hypothetical protein